MAVAVDFIVYPIANSIIYQIQLTAYASIRLLNFYILWFATSITKLQLRQI